MYKEDYSQWGFAVSLGHLTYYSSWETERTSVFFVLNGENYDLETVIEYSSKELSAVEDKMRDDVALSNFSDIGFRTSKWGSTHTCPRRFHFQQRVAINRLFQE